MRHVARIIKTSSYYLKMVAWVPIVDQWVLLHVQSFLFTGLVLPRIIRTSTYYNNNMVTAVPIGALMLGTPHACVSDVHGGNQLRHDKQTTTHPFGPQNW
jgi:ABC-type enterochelin transport system permease subunit